GGTGSHAVDGDRTGRRLAGAAAGREGRAEDDERADIGAVEHLDATDLRDLVDCGARIGRDHRQRARAGPGDARDRADVAGHDVLLALDVPAGARASDGRRDAVLVDLVAHDRGDELRVRTERAGERRAAARHGRELDLHVLADEHLELALLERAGAARGP